MVAQEKPVHITRPCLDLRAQPGRALYLGPPEFKSSVYALLSASQEPGSGRQVLSLLGPLNTWMVMF